MLQFWGWDGYGLPLNNCGLAAREPRPNGAADPTAAAARNHRRVCYDAIARLIQGILVRQRMEQDDAKELLDWSVKYSIDPDEWPAGAIARRLDRICGAGPISSDELEDMGLLLKDLAGDPAPTVAEPAAIPFTEPVPSIEFTNRRFVFTGHFVSGVDACIENIWSRGGVSGETVTALTDFLVIGALRSQEWVANSTGIEVEAALTLSQRNGRPAVISEASFLRAAIECRITNSGCLRPATSLAHASIPLPDPLSRGEENRAASGWPPR